MVDEVPVTDSHAFEGLDRTLRDLMGSIQPMVGVLYGDFRQILPVVQGGTRDNIVS